MQSTTRLFAPSIYGVEVPRVIYGTAWKRERTAGLVEQAIDVGFIGIDTACLPKHYDEAGVGEGLAASVKTESGRKKLYLQTKFSPLAGHDPGNVPYDPNADLAQQVEQSFQVSLRNLRTTYLDCLLLHSPLYFLGGMEAAWQAMEALVDAGVVRQIGITNCKDVPVLDELFQRARIKPAVLQNRFVAVTNYDRDVRSYCQTNGILFQSVWTLTGNPQFRTHATVRALAAQYRRTPEQVLFRYLTQIDIFPLTGTSSAVHMREDLDIFDFELKPAEVDSLRTLC